MREGGERENFSGHAVKSEWKTMQLTDQNMAKEAIGTMETRTKERALV
jgi:hypothetical protein